MKNIKRVIMLLLMMLAIILINPNITNAQANFDYYTTYEETKSDVLDMTDYSVTDDEKVKTNEYETVYKTTYTDKDNNNYYKNNVTYDYNKFLNGHFITYNIFDLNDCEVFNYNNGYISYRKGNNYYVSKYDGLNEKMTFELEKNGNHSYINTIKTFVYNKMIYVFYNIHTQNQSLDIVVCKYSLDGNLLSRRVIGGSSEDKMFDVKRNGDTFYIAATTNSSDGDFGAKLDSIYENNIIIEYSEDLKHIFFSTINGNVDEMEIKINDGIIVLSTLTHRMKNNTILREKVIFTCDLKYDRLQTALGKDTISEGAKTLNIDISGVIYNKDLYIYEVNQNTLTIYKSLKSYDDLLYVRSWKCEEGYEITNISSFNSYGKMFICLTLSNNDVLKNVIYEIDSITNFKEVLTFEDSYIGYDGKKIYSYYNNELIVYSYLQTQPKKTMSYSTSQVTMGGAKINNEYEGYEEVDVETNGYGLYNGVVNLYFNDSVFTYDITFLNLLYINCNTNSGQVFEVGKSFRSNAKMLLDGKEYKNDTLINEIGNHTLQLIGENVDDITFSFVIKDLDKTKDIKEIIFDYNKIEVNENIKSNVKNASSVVDNSGKVEILKQDLSYPVIIAGLILSILVGVIYIRNKKKRSEVKENVGKKSFNKKKKKNRKKGKNYYKNNNNKNYNYNNNYYKKNNNNNKYNNNKKKNFIFILALTLISLCSVKINGEENSETLENDGMPNQSFEVFLKEEVTQNELECGSYKIISEVDGNITKTYLLFEDKKTEIPNDNYSMFEYNSKVYAIRLNENILNEVTSDGLVNKCHIKYYEQTNMYNSSNKGYNYVLKDNLLFITFTSTLFSNVDGFTSYNDKKYQNYSVNFITINLDTFEITNKYLGGYKNQYVIDMFINDYIYLVGCKVLHSDGDFSTAGKKELNTFIAKLNFEGKVLETFTVSGYQDDTKAFLLNKYIYLLSDRMLYKFDTNLKAIDKMKVESNNIFVNDNYVYDFIEEYVIVYDLQNLTKYNCYYLKCNQKVLETNDEGISYLIFETNERTPFELEIKSSKIVSGKLYLEVLEDDKVTTYLCDVCDFRNILDRYIYRSEDYNYQIKTMYDVLDAKKQYKEYFDVMNSGIYHIDLCYYGMYEYVRKIEVEVLEECNVIEGVIYPVGYNLIFSGNGYLNDLNIANNHQIKSPGNYTLKQVFLDGSYKVTNFVVDEKQTSFTDSSNLTKYTYNTNSDVIFDFLVNDINLVINKVYVNDESCVFNFNNNHLLINVGKKDKGEYLDVINGFSYIKDEKEYYYSINKIIPYEVINDLFYVEILSSNENSVKYSINDSDNLKRNIVLKYTNNSQEEMKVYPLTSFTLKVDELEMDNISSLEVLLSYCVDHTIKYVSLFSFNTNIKENDIIGNITYSDNELEFRVNEKNPDLLKALTINGNNKYIIDQLEISSLIKKGLISFIFGLLMMFIVTSFIPMKKIKNKVAIDDSNSKSESVNTKPKGVFTQNLYFKRKTDDSNNPYTKEEEMYLEQLRKDGTIGFIEDDDLDGLDEE